MGEVLGVGVAMGIVATILMDVWAALLKTVLAIPSPNWGMVGRWVSHVPQGQLFHDDISKAPEIPQETAIGWVFHYAVGTIYGVVLALIMGTGWINAPTFLPAWIFAILTIGFGWFLLQPGLGLGRAASKTPNPTKARVLGLAAHTVFGVGLWLGALVFG